MADNQARFLDRIRTALGSTTERGLAWEELIAPSDDREILQSISSRKQQEHLILLQQLTDNALPLHLRVHACASPGAAADCIVAIVRDHEPEFSATKSVVLHDHSLLHRLHLEQLLAAEGIPTQLTRSGGPKVREHTINACIGITVAAWGIAESATIVQLTRPGQPRSTSLVPSIHIAVLPLANLVANLAEAYALIRREQELDSLVLISGPSKTADIEGHMVHGAHGPRAMHLIVLSGEAVDATPA